MIQIINTDLKAQNNQDGRKLLQDIINNNQQLQGRDNFRNIRIAHEGFNRIWSTIVGSGGMKLPNRRDLDRVQSALEKLREFVESVDLKEKNGLFVRRSMGLNVEGGEK